MNAIKTRTENMFLGRLAEPVYCSGLEHRQRVKAFIRAERIPSSMSARHMPEPMLDARKDMGNLKLCDNIGHTERRGPIQKNIWV